MKSTADTSRCRFLAVLFLVVTVFACRGTGLIIGFVVCFVTCFPTEPRSATSQTHLYAVLNDVVERRLLGLCLRNRLDLPTATWKLGVWLSSALLVSKTSEGQAIFITMHDILCVWQSSLTDRAHLAAHLRLCKLEEHACIKAQFNRQKQMRLSCCASQITAKRRSESCYDGLEVWAFRHEAPTNDPTDRAAAKKRSVSCMIAGRIRQADRTEAVEHWQDEGHRLTEDACVHLRILLQLRERLCQLWQERLPCSFCLLHGSHGVQLVDLNWCSVTNDKAASG